MHVFVQETEGQYRFRYETPPCFPPIYLYTLKSVGYAMKPGYKLTTKRNYISFRRKKGSTYLLQWSRSQAE